MIRDEEFPIDPFYYREKVVRMRQFSDWFNREYKRWSRSQPGEEDFLAFCELLGYLPAIVLSWLQGDSVPQGAELLSIAGVFGTKVYSLLGQPEPDPELIKIYNSFAHLTGEHRSRLALALWEVEQRLDKEQIPINSPQARSVIEDVFSKWGFQYSG
jgi:transcriptional regulator with XRE-family HTH domain